MLRGLGRHFLEEGKKLSTREEIDETSRQSIKKEVA